MSKKRFNPFIGNYEKGSIMDQAYKIDRNLKKFDRSISSTSKNSPKYYDEEDDEDEPEEHYTPRERERNYKREERVEVPKEIGVLVVILMMLFVLWYFVLTPVVFFINQNWLPISIIAFVSYVVGIFLLIRLYKKGQI